ncbi:MULTISPECIES: type III-D CRISPR-associated protein Csx19 [unclassified Gordonia (in: high G+C Gram-positive bacteria)]|uniref:type III-D CRISPR-associated protein Csx19 n=1 Tax=unclassified Gordonia (in: high G+C Gram-positive bacteria) TaxID=2657482 RepID=UPI00071D222D|nr:MULTISPECIES: CRISPR-associated protein Csx19 [unclassified Gordonia (in: high G+C Gram-positive bacteria)]KSU56127.1 hypothetical protein AS181_18980 [Gordonia sp. SGD-V-85]SCC49383.1 CRISPR-associated protein, TIGR03984 family [Gordonia sp. v-85]
MNHDEWHTAIPTDAIGFLYTPTAPIWFRRSPHGLVGHDDRPVDTESAFHLRAFNSNTDLTWERVGEVWAHRKVALTADTDTVATTMLLWGEIDDVTPGWAHLRETRISGFWVPIDNAPLGARVSLTCQEVLGTDTFHNTYVAHTALTGIEVHRA